MNKLKVQKYPAYKDSGVEWLGEIPEGWAVLPLFAVTKLKSISGFPELELLSVYLDQGVIKFSDVEAKRTNATSLDLSKYQKVEPGDFVLNNQQAWRGSVGISNYVGIVSPAYIILELSKQIHPIFANYYFRSGAMVSQYLISSRGVGTIQRNLYWPQLRRTYISLPTLQEQTTIAKFLDDKTSKIDRAIAQKEKMIALLKERKQIVIQDLVTGKKVWNPSQNAWTEPAEVKDSGVECLPAGQAGIGEIPEGWEIIALNFIIDAVGDVDHYMPTTTDEGIPYIMTGDLKEFASNIDFEGCKKVSTRDYLNLTKKIKTEKGDVILARYATIGTSTYVDIDSIFLVSYSCVTIKPKRSKLFGLFLFYFFKSNAFATDIKNQINTNTQGNVGIGDLKKVKLILPPLPEQTVIVAHIEAQSAKIDKAIALQEKQIEKLKELKATLIDGAVTGKVRVPSVQERKVS